MLWQAPIPERYTRADPADLARAIAQRKHQLGNRLVILGHHYQMDEVIQHADYTGDSLKLAQIAAGLSTRGELRWVVFCGVHFMAETADMLTPDHVQVILPDLSAGCSMADMAAAEDVHAAWDALHARLARDGYRGRLVPVVYVNSSAAVKAFVGAHGGACCTSSNAQAVLRWALSGAPELDDSPDANAGPSGTGASSVAGDPVRDDVKVLFIPDQHLGRNTAASLGLDIATETCVYDPRVLRRGDPLGGLDPQALRRARVILWAGHCSVHKLFRPEHCAAVRSANGHHAPPSAQPMRILVHPECVREVVEQADLVGSTEFIIRTIRQAPPGSRWAVGTEVHLVNRLAREAATRGVYVRLLSDCQCLCTTMFRIDPPHLLWALDHLAGIPSGTPQAVNVIRVPSDIRHDALRALRRMLSLTRAPTLAAAE